MFFRLVLFITILACLNGATSHLHAKDSKIPQSHLSPKKYIVANIITNAFAVKLSTRIVNGGLTFFYSFLSKKLLSNPLFYKIYAGLNVDYSNLFLHNRLSQLSTYQTNIVLRSLWSYKNYNRLMYFISIQLGLAYIHVDKNILGVNIQSGIGNVTRVLTGFRFTLIEKKNFEIALHSGYVFQLISTGRLINHLLALGFEVGF